VVDLLRNKEEVDDIRARRNVMPELCVGVRIVVYALRAVDDVVEYPVSQLSWEVEELECAGPFG
jgi:hypothetical protein